MKNEALPSTLAMEIAATFNIENDCLAIGGIPLLRLALQVGQTPFFAYSRSRVDQRISLLRRVLPVEVAIHYAIKANPFVPLVQHLSRNVAGFDVASAKEMALALDTGIQAEHISISGPGKRDEDLLKAIAAGVLINAESPGELQRTHALASAHGIRARVALRVNPAYKLSASGMKMGGGAKPFGSDAAFIPDMLEQVGRYGDFLVFEGFQIYPGSQNLRADHLIDAQEKAVDLVMELARRAPSPVRCVNLGGGFGIPYFQGDTELDVAAVGAAMHGLMARMKKALPDAKVVLELGRYLVGPAGIYVARVVDRKRSHGMIFLVVDGGMHHHLAASGNLGQLIRRNYPVVIGNRVRGASGERANVVGPLCTPLDILVKEGTLGGAAPGDFVVVFQSGAYGLTASPSAFLSQPMAAEVLTP